MTEKINDPKVPVTVWMPKSLRDEANEVAQEFGEVSRMVRRGLRKEIALKRKELNNLEPEQQAS